MTEKQLRRVWQNRTTRIWRELAQRVALPMPVPRRVREIVEGDFAEEVTEACRTAGGEAVLDGLLTDYGERAEEELFEFLRGLLAHIQGLHNKGLLDAKEGGRSSGEDRSDPAQEFRLRHRRRVLEFVAQREVPLVHLLEGHFGTGGRPILWENLALQWRRSHPKDRLKPDTLRRYYYRARRDQRVREPFIRDLRRSWAEWAHKVSGIVGMLEEAGARKEDIFVRFTEPRPADHALASAFNLPPGAPVREAVCRLKYPPKLAAAFRAAVREKCAWTARTFALPRDFHFCTRRDCRRCPVFRALREAGFLHVSAETLRDPERLGAWREDEVRRFREQFVLQPVTCAACSKVFHTSERDARYCPECRPQSDAP